MMKLFEKKNRNKLYAIGIALVVVSIYIGVQPGILSVFGVADVGDSQCSYNYFLQGLDSDGNTVEIPVDTNPLQTMFTVGGVELRWIKPGISWTVGGEGLNLSTLVVTLRVEIFVASDYSFNYVLEDTLGIVSYSADDVFRWTLELGIDIAYDETYRLNGDLFSEVYSGFGWYYKFKYRIDVTVDDVFGDTLSAGLDLGAFGVWMMEGSGETRGDQPPQENYD